MMPNDLRQLDALGFEEITTSPPIRRLIVAVEGFPKYGKSHFVLTAPGPLVILDFDYGLEGLIHRFAGSKKIRRESYDYRSIQIDGGYIQLWDKFRRDFLKVLEVKAVRSIGIDTFTEAYELLRLARFGGKPTNIPRHYEPLNAEMRELFRRCLISDKNVILTHKMRGEFIGGGGGDVARFTGNYVRSGWGDSEGLAQVNLRVFRDGLDGRFGATILNCRQNAACAGVTLMEPACSFQFLGCEVFPDSEMEEWE